MKVLITTALFLISISLCAQENEQITWYNVEEMVMGGKLEMKGSNPFQRFPDSMQKLVRNRVWDLSENPAGVHVNFETNAAEVFVEYQVKGPLEFPHMPAIGVSGVDPYSFKEGSWKWVKGKFSFQDTITFHFHLKTSKNEVQQKFRLYLPLYNIPFNMRIGVNKGADFKEILMGKKAPVVVYGTSITQGACAGRPGLAWTSILSRGTYSPVLNYGFSGNGRLEEEIIKFLSQIEARVFILDCLANFTSGQGLDAKQARIRLVKSVEMLRKSQPETPIIITDHAGYPHGEIFEPEKILYLKLNNANQEAFKILNEKGIKNLFLLKNQQLGLNENDFIDGVHPNDAGMQKYARAYHNLLAEIMSKLP